MRAVIIPKVVIKNNTMKVLPGSPQLTRECSFVNCVVHHTTGIENTLLSSFLSFFPTGDFFFLEEDFFNLKRL